MVCYFDCEPRADAYWIQLGEGGPSVCGQFAAEHRRSDDEIERVTDLHMAEHLAALCKEHVLRRAGATRLNVFNELRQRTRVFRGDHFSPQHP